MLRIVQDAYNGHFKVCLDSQDHLGEVQHQRHQGVGQEQGLPQRVNFCKKNALLGIVQDGYNGHFKVFLDSQDHLGEVQPQRHQGVGQEQSKDFPRE